MVASRPVPNLSRAQTALNIDSIVAPIATRVAKRPEIKHGLCNKTLTYDSDSEPSSIVSCPKRLAICKECRMSTMIQCEEGYDQDAQTTWETLSPVADGATTNFRNRGIQFLTS